MNRDERQRLLAVIIPGASGKTQLCQRLQTYAHTQAKEHHFIDIDEFSLSYPDIAQLTRNETAKALELLPRLKSDIYKVVQQNPQTTVVVVTASVTFVDMLGIKPKRITVFAPTLDFYARKLIADLFTPEVKAPGEGTSGPEETRIEKFYQIQAKREAILRRYPTVVKLYGSFEELEALFVKTFDLTRQT